MKREKNNTVLQLFRVDNNNKKLWFYTQTDRAREIRAKGGTEYDLLYINNSLFWLKTKLTYHQSLCARETKHT